MNCTWIFGFTAHWPALLRSSAAWEPELSITSSSVAAVTTAIFPADASEELVIFKKGSAFVPQQLLHTYQSGLTLIGGKFL